MSDAKDWLEKGKGDLDMVRRSLIPMPEQNLEAAAYHLQQAAEKAMKALLAHLGIPYPRGGGRGTRPRLDFGQYSFISSASR